MPLEMFNPMRDMLVNMDETVWSKTLKQLMSDLVWPAAASSAAVARRPKEANPMLAPLDL